MALCQPAYNLETMSAHNMWFKMKIFHEWVIAYLHANVYAGAQS